MAIALENIIFPLDAPPELPLDGCERKPCCGCDFVAVLTDEGGTNAKRVGDRRYGDDKLPEL